MRDSGATVVLAITIFLVMTALLILGSYKVIGTARTSSVAHKNTAYLFFQTQNIWNVGVFSTRVFAPRLVHHCPLPFVLLCEILLGRVWTRLDSPLTLAKQLDSSSSKFFISV